MKILIASQNQGKIEGAKKAFSHYFSNFTIEGISVPSNVHEQPVDNEIYIGAKNRIKNLKAYCKENGIFADLFISIESGIANIFDNWFITNIAIIENNDNFSSCGTSASFPVPEKYVKKIIDSGLGNVINEIFYKDDERHNNGGSIQLLSKNVISRIDLSEQAFIMALTKYINSKWN